MKLTGITPAARTGGTLETQAKSAVSAVQTESRGTERDRLELSQAAMRWVETLNDRRFQAQERAAALEQQKSGGTDLLRQLEDANRSAEAQSETFEVMSRCMKIAANLLKGKRVPPRDLQYLMEHDAELYKLAISMRSLNRKKDDEESDPVITDEEEDASLKFEDGAGASGESVPTASAQESGSETDA